MNISSSQQTEDTTEYTQACRSRTATLLGIEWTSENEILYLTNQGLELYTVVFAKRLLKKPFIYNLSMNWFVYAVSYGCSCGGLVKCDY
jgi:hypothetical protein